MGVGGGAVKGGEGVVGGGDFVTNSGAVGLTFERGGPTAWRGDVLGLRKW